MTDFDKQFGEDLVEAQPLMKRLARKYARHGDDAEDICQSAALNAWTFRADFRGNNSQFTCWLHTIIRNVVFDAGRKRHFRQEVQIVPAYDVRDARSTPSDQIEVRNEKRLIVSKLMLTLSDTLRASVHIRLDPSRQRKMTNGEKLLYRRAIIVLRTKFQRMAA